MNVESSNSISVGTKIEFEPLDEGIGRIIKKQKTTMTKTISDIDSIISSLKTCKSQINLYQENTDNNNNNGEMNIDNLLSKSISKLHSTTYESKLLSKMSNEHKELHAPISKFGKVIDKNFRSDIETSTRDDMEFDKSTLNEIIIQHLYRIGGFEIAELLQKESDVKVTIPEETKNKLIYHQTIIESLEKHTNLTGAIQWCLEHRDQLKRINSQLEFNLHRLQFIILLKSSSNNINNSNSSNQFSEALLYARTHFPPFATTHQKELQVLMGSFVFAQRLSDSPYSHLFNDTAIDDQWREIRIQFAKNANTIMGLPQESPLSVVLTVGMKALPTFLKLATFIVLKDFNSESLAVEIRVDQEHNYHSVFACPVSKEQSTKSNPPVMLQCGHLLCKNSMQKLVKGNHPKFKCPYCPMEQVVSNVKQVYF